jgi:endonuclease YncB( thermonuclease family)
MSSRGGWFGVFLGLMLSFVLAGSASAMSPRYTLLGRAQVVDVETPNLLKIRLQGQDRVITIRLLGVGTPRNKDRIKHLNHEVVSYIERTDVWERSRTYLRTLLDRKIVEIWARRWDRSDEKNRVLAYVIMKDQSRESVDVNAEIISQGLGFVTRDYVHVTYAGYRVLEEDAKKKRRGIWGGLPMGRVSSLDK